MECEVFMGVEDMRRQSLNVFKMELLGATVTGVSSGTGTLKDACNEAMRAWASRCDDTFYVLGSAVGPHPYPMIVRDFQKIISEEMKAVSGKGRTSAGCSHRLCGRRQQCYRYLL